MNGTAKTLLSLGLSVLVAAAFVPIAWAEGGVSAAVGNDIADEDGGIEVVADAARPQSDIVATPGWELIGSCEWKMEDKTIVLRPAGNSAEGELPDSDSFGSSGTDSPGWPWGSGGECTSFRIEGQIICDGALRDMFYNFGYLETIEGLNNLDTSKVTDMSGMFASCTSLTSLDLSSFDTSSVTNMSGMFSNCISLVSLDLSSFDTSTVMNMSGMFTACMSLMSLDLSPLNTSSVTNMDDMFAKCSSLSSLDVSSLVTSKVVSMENMFNGCSALSSLNLSSFDTSKVKNMNSMFDTCSSLKSLGLSSFDTSNVESMTWIFERCSSLELVAVGEKCTVQSELPDKTWYNAAGESFTPSTIPVGVAGTYATSRDLLEPTKVTLNETAKTVSADAEPFTLVATVTPEWKAGPVTWRSSDPSVATVDSDGKVTVHKAGKADISAEFEDAKAVCALTVEPMAVTPPNGEGDNGSSGNTNKPEGRPGVDVEGPGGTGHPGADTPNPLKKEPVKDGAGTGGVKATDSGKHDSSSAVSARKPLPQTDDPAGAFFASAFALLLLAALVAAVARKLSVRTCDFLGYKGL